MSEQKHSETAEIGIGDPSSRDAQLALAVLESVPGIFYVFDQNGSFRHWNANLEFVTGYSSEEVAALHPLDLFSADWREKVKAAIDLAFEMGRASIEAPMLTRHGSTPPYSFYGRLVQIGGESMIAGMGLDISRLKEAQKARDEQSQQLRHLASHVPGVIYQLRYDNDLRRFSLPYASDKLFEVFGVRLNDVANDAKPLLDRIASEDAARFRRAVEVSGRDLSPFHQQFRLVPPGGDLEHAEWVEIESSPERLADGSVLWHGFARLITERRRMEDELTRLAYYDTLTSMPNRMLLQLSLENQISDAEIIGEGLALLHLDLDNFKDINDIWGHSTGDNLLTVLAERLATVVGENATIGRIGGDDFLVILKGRDISARAERLAESLVAALDSSIELDQRLVRVTGSIGISLFPDDGETAEDLLRHADAALYRAKADGPGSWAMYTPELTAAAMARRYMETELRAAVDQNDIQVALQPIVDLRTGAVAGFEALARWHHKEDGWIDPEQFIMLAESRGLVGQLGEQVYRKAMQAIVEMNEPFFLALNVAPVQLRDPQFCRRLVRLSEESGLDPGQIEVEITERAFMAEIDANLRQMHALRERGISIAIDDFGTGYSSLAYLRNLPIQRLKIDQVFVRDVARVRQNGAIVKAVVTLADELDIAVTAEGVQTREELEFMQACGCHYAQGWHFGRGKLVKLQTGSAATSQSHSSQSSSSQAS